MAMFHVVLSQSGPEWDRSQPIDGQSGWPEHAAFILRRGSQPGRATRGAGRTS